MYNIDIDDLRGRIYKYFKTQAAFSKAMKWHPVKTSKFLRGRYMPSVEETAQMSVLLKMNTQEYFDIFLRSTLPNGNM